jgi:hypothetical protein
MTPKIFKDNIDLFRKRKLFYLSQLLTPQGTHLISWSTYIASLVKKGRTHTHKWYLDIQQRLTIPDSHNLLKDAYRRDSPPAILPAVVLAPCTSTKPTTMDWIVTLYDGAPVFGKQIANQPVAATSTIFHWVSDCVDSPGDNIKLQPCPGCAFNTFKKNKKPTAVPPTCTRTVSQLQSLILPTVKQLIMHTTTVVSSPLTWADIDNAAEKNQRAIIIFFFIPAIF